MMPRGAIVAVVKFWARTSLWLLRRICGTTVEFRVTKVQEYLKDKFPTQDVYGPTPDAELRLITCGGVLDGEVLDDPGSFKTKEESKLSVLEHILQPELYPQLYGNICHKVRINYYPPRGDNKEGWDNIDIFGWLGYPMQIKVDFLCRDSILAAPLVLDLALFFDLAARALYEFV